MIKPWQWSKSDAEKTTRGGDIWRLRDGKGNERATIWCNPGDFTWHTWDTNGVGGENDTQSTLADAMRNVLASIVVQGWAPGGWRVVER